VLLMTNTTSNPAVANLDHGSESAYQLDHVSDADLLDGTRRLVGRSNQVLAALLAHLAEVEARGIHRVRACSSLYTYCVYELRFSEDAAFRRSRAARIARQFPVIFQQVADGELHLTALVLLAPHLTQENHRELLALAKHRTKREVLRLVRALAPAPSVPDRVEPLGPDPGGIPLPGVPNWRTMVESFGAPVRELSSGDRPKDWVEPACDTGLNEDRGGAGAGSSGSVSASAPCAADATRRPERYQVSFTASQAYVDLLERAQDLLSHAVPQRSLEEVHLRALRLLVGRLEKRKYGAPRPPPPAVAARAEPDGGAESAQGDARRARQSKKRTHAPRQRVEAGERRSGAAAARREVRDRDGTQCAFVDERGQRCRETRFLELHHELAYALGGETVASNLRLYCQAHNALAAERDFGREFMQARRGAPFATSRMVARPPP